MMAMVEGGGEGKCRSWHLKYRWGGGFEKLQFLNVGHEDFWNFCNITDRSFTGDGQTAAGFSEKFPELRGD